LLLWSDSSQPLDASFDASEALNYWAKVLAAQPDGGIIVGSVFNANP
jgi:hypothetical protein